MTYKVINQLDFYSFDKPPIFRNVRFFQQEKSEQIDSHGYSYLFTRQQLQERGYTMGFDLPVQLDFFEESDLEKHVRL